MPLSKNLNTYYDILQVLTTARAAGGISTYALPTAGAATNWVARAYNYRALLIKAAVARAGQVKGFIPSTEWDDLLLIREGNIVKISFNRVVGVLTAETGEKLDILTPPKDTGAAESMIENLTPRSTEEVGINLDSLEEFAKNLVKEKGA